jgi:hypothetical protein
MTLAEVSAFSDYMRDYQKAVERANKRAARR